MKLLACNDISLSDDESIGMSEYINREPLTWNSFLNFLSDKPFKIRLEILNLTPRTGFFFNALFL